MEGLEQELEAKTESLNELEAEVSTLRLKNCNIELEIQRHRESSNEHMQELDRLYKENETIRTDLTAWQKKFDPEEVESKMQLGRAKDEQVKKLVSLVKEWFNFIENLATCAMCQDVVSEAMVLDPCSHNFCSLCLESRVEHKDRCPECRMKTASTFENKILDHVMQKHKTKRPLFEEVMKHEAILKKF